MSQALRFKGDPTGLTKRTLGRVTFSEVSIEERGDFFFAITANTPKESLRNLDQYLGIVVEKGAEKKVPAGTAAPVVTGYEDLKTISQDTVIAINPGSGSTYLLYRPESMHNVIFSTVRCNSNCLMCSQPPALSEDDAIVQEHLRLIDLIKEEPKVLGISGGEPTLLKEGLIEILERLKQRFPTTHVQMLTNGRLYAYENLTREIAAVDMESFVSAIPLYADNAIDHDYTVQAKGAFDETLRGIYNAAKHGLNIEIRVVLHKQTLDRLPQLVEFIYRNLPFVSHVALMGLENMGYVKKNWNLLWVDPVDYVETLEKVVRYLHLRRMPVSIYNLPLCVLPRKLWLFARQSISDYKNILLQECGGCDASARCSGLFQSSEARHSRGIRAIKWDSDPFDKYFEKPTAS